jgi:DNA replication protein DnaC
MNSINETISYLISNGKLSIREPKSYSFGTYEQCKELFIKSFMAFDKTVKKLELLPEYEEVINWMTDTNGKGLALAGSLGRGKSIILNGVLPIAFFTKNMVLKPKLAIELSPDLTNQMKSSWAVAIDDIGQENVINNFGTKIDAVEILISHCEDRLKPLFLTTNLDYEQIIERYGPRISDRITRLCKVVEFMGESLRK